MIPEGRMCSSNDIDCAGGRSTICSISFQLIAEEGIPATRLLTCEDTPPPLPSLIAVACSAGRPEATGQVQTDNASGFARVRRAFAAFLMVCHSADWTKPGDPPLPFPSLFLVCTTVLSLCHGSMPLVFQRSLHIYSAIGGIGIYFGC